MKSIRIILIIALLAGALGLLTGCAKNPDQIQAAPVGFVRFVDIYVSEGGKFILTGGLEPTEPILVFAGDRVIFNNMGVEEVVLTLPEGVFDEKEIKIAPNKRVILKVIAEGALAGDVSGDRGDQKIDGDPKMKVGEEP